jgi:hypothetical protein
MDITGRLTGLVILALVVFFLIKYVFPLIGAVVTFLSTFLQHLGRCFPT